MRSDCLSCCLGILGKGLALPGATLLCLVGTHTDGGEGTGWDGVDIPPEPLGGCGMMRSGSQDPMDYSTGETRMLCPFSSEFP